MDVCNGDAPSPKNPSIHFVRLPDDGYINWPKYVVARELCCVVLCCVVLCCVIGTCKR